MQYRKQMGMLTIIVCRKYSGIGDRQKKELHIQTENRAANMYLQKWFI